MAVLSDKQWAEIRAEWEASDRQGFEWLSYKHGGRWDVSPEPIRRRRLREGWTKAGAYLAELPPAARKTHADTDRKTVARLAVEAAADPGATPFGEGAEPSPVEVVTEAMAEPVEPRAPQPLARPPVDPPSEAEIVAQDLRNQLLDLHRKEWRIGRRLLHGALDAARGAESRGEVALALDKMRLAKTGLEALGILHNGESRAWGLEADLIDFEKLSDEQLLVVGQGKLLK